MKKKPKLIFIEIVFLVFLLGIMVSSPTKEMDQRNSIDSEIKDQPRNEIDLKHLKTSKFWIMSNITIDDDGGTFGAFTWAQAEGEDWCSGQGTWSKPYIIENVTINAGGSGNGLYIRDSMVYFVIRNCTVYNSGSGTINAGIRLQNTENGIFEKNNCSENNYNGISLSNCFNNTIVGNILKDNDENGIYLSSNSRNNTIINNNCSDTNKGSVQERGIYLYESTNNTILDNHIQDNDYDSIRLVTNCHDNIIHNNTLTETSAGATPSDGIFMYHSDRNRISDNIIFKQGPWGISMTENCNNNTFIGNTISNNTRGIHFGTNCENNTVTENEISNNGIYGAYISVNTAKNNRFYKNAFVNNIISHAYDAGDPNNNKWDYSHIGNYWDNHTAPDTDRDAIVDTPYTWIAGAAYSIDNYPFTQSPIFIGDRIHIDDSGATALNWSTTAKMMDWCSGSGSYTDPYILEGLEIDGEGVRDSCILIGNSSVYFTIQSCKLYNTLHKLTDKIDAGIRLDYTNNGTLINNDCSDNGNGITLYLECDNNTISGNNVSSNWEHGIIVYGFSYENVISNNTANENDDYGISIIGYSDDNTITDNIVNENEKHGIYLNDHSERNTISGNTAKNNTQYGIYLNNNCDDNTIWTNIIANNTQYGVVVESSSIGNFIYQNAFIGNNLHAQDATSANDNFWNKTLIGNYWDNHTAPDSNKDGIVDTPYTWITGAANSVDNYPLSQSPVNIGERIHIDDSGVSALNWSTTAKLMIWCTGSGSYSDPYLLEGLEIDGKNMGNCILIGNSSVYFTIKNCKVFSSVGGLHEGGIKLEYTSNGTIINNNCSNNGDHGIVLYRECDNNTISGNIANDNVDDGIYLYQCDENIITGNTANRNPDGLVIRYSHYNTISGNTANENLQGIYFYESTNNTISGNTANENTLYEGIILYQCDNNTVSGNTANKNDDHGIKIYQGKDNKILGNTANENSQHGIFLENGCDDNKILGNTANENSQHGIFLENGCDENTISGNNANNNTESGIFLYEYCDENTITGNTANNNTMLGINLDDKCHENTISGNTANNNKWDGIKLDDNCNNNTISDNFAINNEYGIGLYLNSNNNTISGNTINENGDVGMLFQSSCVNNTVSGNTANENINHGIRLEFFCDNNTISGNNANNNTYSGIFLTDDCINNTISGNTANNNTESGIFLDNNCDENTISGNILKYNDRHGINIDSSDNSYIYNNNLTNNGQSGNFDGISLEDAHWNHITGNKITNNTGKGIELSQSDNNNITRNDIFFNDVGIHIHTDSNYTTIYLNYFRDNTNHAIDDCIGNLWNSSIIGNFWDNYTGSDPDGDGIGNTPHLLPGTVGAQDNKPIWKITPELTLGYLDPKMGNQNTEFTFRITYTDQPNREPTTIYVVINGTSYAMIKEDGSDSNYADGCIYNYTTTLAYATHNYTYYFECSIGSSINSTRVYNDLFVYKAVAAPSSGGGGGGGGGGDDTEELTIPGYNTYFIISIIGIFSIILIKKRWK